MELLLSENLGSSWCYPLYHLASMTLCWANHTNAKGLLSRWTCALIIILYLWRFGWYASLPALELREPPSQLRTSLQPWLSLSSSHYCLALTSVKMLRTLLNDQHTLTYSEQRRVRSWDIQLPLSAYCLSFARKNKCVSGLLDLSSP